ncbi:1-deoxy-D-xylulose 5-phosphate reductoisomerase [hydrothermal vent metagenome]|uniref:1-deoxy-D-xylulose-5-phosphate reductoisomerase n=1 Tax=hydrothermal vent metagenome TaxID=652676 RepID=A0A3B0VIK8_9ZZZZ
MSKVKCKNLVILGATGSIGDSALNIIARHPDKFNVYAITGHANIKKLVQLCKKFNPKYAVISNPACYLELKSQVGTTTKVLAGTAELSNICQLPEVDMVVAGIVGSAGMQPVLATVTAGKDLLLANKEALVVAGDLVIQAAIKNNANIIPLDSEHNAIFQCLPDDYKVGTTPKDLDKIILTASGGPFWDRDIHTFEDITPEQACAHPNWSMGKKISVDSASMMNKGLEIIEAHWLFNLNVDKIDVHIHPQSIIHSMVCYKDGSILAQLGKPDMRIPIAYGLGLRKRITSGANLIDLLTAEQLQFFKPDYVKFPCLALAQDAINSGGTAMATLNTANEVSVAAFLNGQISFTNIAAINQQVMQQTTIHRIESVQHLLELDIEIRTITQQEAKAYA